MSPGEPPGDGDPMDLLRELLVGPEREDLADLRRIVTDPAERAHELSRILPHAVRLSTTQDAQLSEALAPTIESALKESVKKDPSVLTDVVFPIIGPAIRRAMADAFSKMLQSLNQTLEHSVSLQGFKWRFEAARTGKSFAEVVIARTLVYRVEQVFLIHKETGLLLAHVQAANAGAQDADMISGMHTAIQDFMSDAFQAEGDGKSTTQRGDHTLWGESSRRLTLAAFIRGIAPEEYRETLKAALERISIEQRTALANFSGDAAPFEASRPVLENCLQEQIAAPSRKLSPLIWIVPLLLFAAGILYWSYAADRESQGQAGEEQAEVEAEQRRHAAHRAVRDEQREADLLAKYARQLNAEEGIVVTEALRRDGRNYVAGLRDPLAANPETFLGASGIPPDGITSHWEAYYALTPGLVVKRAAKRIEPPPTITLAMRGETLVANGSATAEWVAAAQQRVEVIPGVTAFDTSGVVDETLAALAAKKRAIDETVLYFGDGADLSAESEAALHQLATQIKDLRHAAGEVGRRVRITVTGHTTEAGGEAFNLKLSRSRADRIVATLVLDGVEATVLAAAGAAAHERKYVAAEEDGRNRRVTFQADFARANPGSPKP